MEGRALTLYYLLREVSADTDVFDSGNKVVFATSVITGAPTPGTSRHSVVAKLPLTNAYGESEAGGYWGVELKFAGFDAIIIEGKAGKPVYLWIHHGEAEIKSAEHMGHKALHDKIVISSEGCHACPVRCKRICKLEGEPYER